MGSHFCARQDRAYSGPHYHVVHSAGHDRNSGVLIMVAKWCRTKQLIRHCAVIPGRLLHVRLHTPGAAVDALCIYQYPWAHHINSIGIQAKRGAVWAVASLTY